MTCFYLASIKIKGLSRNARNLKCRKAIVYLCYMSFSERDVEPQKEAMVGIQENAPESFSRVTAGAIEQE